MIRVILILDNDKRRYARSRRGKGGGARSGRWWRGALIIIIIIAIIIILAIFYPFSQFCEIGISLLSLQTQPNTAPNFISEGGRIWQVCYHYY